MIYLNRNWQRFGSKINGKYVMNFVIATLFISDIKFDFVFFRDLLLGLSDFRQERGNFQPDFGQDPQNPSS